MSHRTTADDRERVQLARHPARFSDAHLTATEEAYREIAAGRYRGVSRSTVGLNLGQVESPDAAVVAALARALAHAAVVPNAVAVACPEHGAEPGQWCYRGARGVCADRIERRPRDG